MIKIRKNWVKNKGKWKKGERQEDRDEKIKEEKVTNKQNKKKKGSINETKVEE